MQNSNSSMCGSFCISIAYLVVLSTNSNGGAPDFVLMWV